MNVNANFKAELSLQLLFQLWSKVWSSRSCQLTLSSITMGKVFDGFVILYYCKSIQVENLVLVYRNDRLQKIYSIMG